MERTYSLADLKFGLALHPWGLNEKATDKQLTDFLLHPQNIVLKEGDNIGVFTFNAPGYHTGHWFFTVRGRQAIELAKEMVHKYFSEYGGKVLRGLTPIQLKAACWAARKIGMTSYGQVTFADGEVDELFIMTKEEFYERNNLDGLT